MNAYARACGASSLLSISRCKTPIQSSSLARTMCTPKSCQIWPCHSILLHFPINPTRKFIRPLFPDARWLKIIGSRQAAHNRLCRATCTIAMEGVQTAIANQIVVLALFGRCEFAAIPDPANMPITLAWSFSRRCVNVRRHQRRIFGEKHMIRRRHQHERGSAVRPADFMQLIHEARIQFRGDAPSGKERTAWSGIIRVQFERRRSSAYRSSQYRSSAARDRSISRRSHAAKSLYWMRSGENIIPS